MELVIYSNEHYEEESALVDRSTNKVILKGDYYHDKISFRIEGYLRALKDTKVYEKDVATEVIGREHPLYKELAFYDEET